MERGRTELQPSRGRRRATRLGLGLCRGEHQPGRDRGRDRSRADSPDPRGELALVSPPLGQASNTSQSRGDHAPMEVSQGGRERLRSGGRRFGSPRPGRVAAHRARPRQAAADDHHRRGGNRKISSDRGLVLALLPAGQGRRAGAQLVSGATRGPLAQPGRARTHHQHAVPGQLARGEHSPGRAAQPRDPPKKHRALEHGN